MHTHTNATATATSRKGMNAGQRAHADAYAYLVQTALGLTVGRCTMAGCTKAARDMAHLVPARDGGRYIGDTLPTCKDCNDDAEGLPRVPAMDAAREAALRMTRADAIAYATAWQAAVASHRPDTFTLGE